MDELFSKRNQPKKSAPLANNQLCNKFRIQLIKALNNYVGLYVDWAGDALNAGQNHIITGNANSRWNDICESFHEEHGRVYDTNQATYIVITRLLSDHSRVFEVLDIIELAIAKIAPIDQNLAAYEIDKFNKGRKLSTQEFIEKVNGRFSENSIGYRIENNKIIKIESEFIQNNITHIAFELLSDDRFSSTLSTFSEAYRKYKSGEFKDAIRDSREAFESTVKIICKELDLEFKPEDKLHKLIELLFQKGLIPKYLQEQFTQLRGLLQSGSPTIGNNYSHAQIDQPSEATEHLTSYMLNLTAINIVYLIRSLNSFKKI